MDKVREALDAINHAWRSRDFAALEALVDENIVMKGPRLQEFVRGRPAFVESYVQFMTHSHIVEYTESKHAIDTWGDVAMATYDWAMTYQQKGETKTENGQDMFIFRRKGAAWIAVFRLILF